MRRLLARTIVIAIVALATMVTSGPLAARQGPAPVVSAPRDLGTLEQSSHVTHVSQSGVVVGANSGSGSRAFAWTEAGGMVPLTFDGGESQTVDVTDSGIVLGQYFSLDFSTGSGFIWTETGGL